MKHKIITLILSLVSVSLLASDSFWSKVYSFENDSLQLEYLVNSGGKLLYTSPDEIPRLVELLDSIYAENHNVKAKSGSLMFQSLLVRNEGNIDSAILIQQNAIQLLKNAPPNELLCNLYNITGISFYRKGDVIKQLNYNDSAITIARELHLENIEVTLIQNRAYIKRTLGKTDEAIQTLNALLKKAKDNRQSSTILINLGILYSDINHNDSAIWCYQTAAQKAEYYEEWQYKASALAHICELQLSIEQAENILPYINQADSIYKELNDINNIFRMLSIRTFYNIQSKNYEAADTNSLELIQLAESYNNERFKIDAYRLRSQLLEASDNWEDALTYYRKYRVLKDSLNNEDLQHELANLEVKFETSEKQRKLDLMKKQKELDDKRQIIYYSIGVSAILLLVLIIVVIVFINRQRILKNEQQKLQLKQEIERNQAEIDQKNRQLTSKALHLSERHELLEEILTITKDDPQNGLDQIKRKVKSKLNSESDWEEFRIYFEELNPDFFTKVKAIKPELTDRELRLLALIKIGLNIREVANLLHIESNSVKVARYRLKKKFELDTDDSLEAFVNRL